MAERRRNKEPISRVLELFDFLFNRMQETVSLLECRDGVYYYVKNNTAHQLFTGYKDIQGMELSKVIGAEACEEMREHLEQCLRTGETRIYHKKYDFGPERYMGLTELVPLLDEGASCILLVSRELIGVKQVKKENQKLAQRLCTLFHEHSAFKMEFHGNSGEITEVNPALCSYLGYSREEMVGHALGKFNLLPQEMQQEQIHREFLSGTLFSAAPFLLKSGEIKLFDVYASVLAEGEHPLFSTVLFDVTDRERYQRNVEFLSYHDALTGLYNRHYVEEVIPRLNQSENLPMAVIMGDINGLKVTNDAFGHKAGDTLLKNVAQLLQESCKREALIARWGGDEFVAFIPHTNLDQAEEITQQIKNTPIFIKDKGLQGNLSLGYAVKDSLEATIADTLREAEEYMYRYKLLNGKSYRNAIMNTLLAILYENSNETEEHSRRLEEYCHVMGRELGISSIQMAELSMLALLHDVGKVAIDPHILKKPGPLTPEEWLEMKRHPEIGCRIAQAAPELAMVSEFILSHHERWDGKGYPCGLKGEEIALPCRILAVADAFDAMTNDRVYRQAMSKARALREIEKNAGTQFDPLVVQIFLRHAREYGQ